MSIDLQTELKNHAEDENMEHLISFYNCLLFGVLVLVLRNRVSSRVDHNVTSSLLLIHLDVFAI